MAEVTLTKTRVRAGVWEGVLATPGTAKPQLEVLHLEQKMPGLTVSELPDQPGRYAVRLPIPSRERGRGNGGGGLHRPGLERDHRGHRVHPCGGGAVRVCADPFRRRDLGAQQGFQTASQTFGFFGDHGVSLGCAHRRVGGERVM